MNIRRQEIRHGETLMRVRVGVMALVASGISIGLPLAKSKTALDIQAGPSVISEEEKAIVADPEKGMEHGVILAAEYVVNENVGTDNRFGQHIRAKILAAEGAALANIEIPHDIMVGTLEDWWGRTLLPDGRVLELKQEQLLEQSVAQSRGNREIRFLKGALPGVVPGCVIDYGYIYVGEGGIVPERHVLLQKAWPIRKLDFRWVPYAIKKASTSFKVLHAQGLSVTTARDNNSVLLQGRDLPAFHTEPWMPPVSEVQAEAVFSYLGSASNPESLWANLATSIERGVSEFNKPDEIKTAALAIPQPPGADLTTKLKTAYTWILDNIKNVTHKTSEDIEADVRASQQKQKKEEESVGGARDVLTQKRAGGFGIDVLFVGFARALGAEAHIVQAPDRTRNYWDPSKRDLDQLRYRLVAVGEPGAPYETFTILSPADKLPYGQVPWWLTGVRGLLALPGGARTIMIPPSPAKDSGSEAKVDLRFTEDNAAIDVKWSRRATGQSWYLDRVNMRTYLPDARKKRVDAICGASSTFELSRAEIEGLDDPRKPLQLTCEGQILDSGFTDADTHAMKIEGAWIEGVPELKDPHRTYPVIFNHTHADTTELDVHAPAGYVPKAPPPVINLESRYGTYQLLVSAEDDEYYHVKRSFTLLQIAASPEDYQTLRNFLNDARQADRTRLMFAKKEAK